MLSPGPTPPSAQPGSATLRVRMNLKAVNSLKKGSTVSLSKMIVVLTSNAVSPTAVDTVRDTLRTSGTTPTISPTSTADQPVNKTYAVKGLRAWKISVSVRDSRDSLVHFDTATTPVLAVGDTASVNLGLSSRYAMYDAHFQSLPAYISATSGDVQQALNVTRLVLRVDGEALRDSLANPGPYFSPGGLGHHLDYDYVSTGTKKALGSGTSSNLNAVFFTSATDGVLVGAGGTVRRTVDAGANWNPATTPGTAKALRSVYFLNATNGWIVGDSIAWRTVNGGLNWTAQTTPSPFNTPLRSVHFTDANKGWAVGDSAYRTTDGGVSWSKFTIGISAFSVRMIGADTGYLVGTNASGTVRKTVNGSAVTPVWSAQSTPSTRALKSVFPVNGSLVYAVGDTGTILRTTNGGANWVQQTTGVPAKNLKSVHFLDAAVGYAVGDNGTILATADSGRNWAVQTSPVTANLTSIHFTGTKAYAVGDNGTLFLLTGPRLVTLEVYGLAGNFTGPLFSGSKYVNVATGADASVAMTLNWVGPKTGGGQITAVLSRVGRVNIIGKLPGTP
jgi:photosystem II stability/assembly factor-like uncharacterized protein